MMGGFITAIMAGIANIGMAAAGIAARTATVDMETVMTVETEIGIAVADIATEASSILRGH